MPRSTRKPVQQFPVHTLTKAVIVSELVDFALIHLAGTRIKTALRHLAPAMHVGFQIARRSKRKDALEKWLVHEIDKRLPVQACESYAHAVWEAYRSAVEDSPNGGTADYVQEQLDDERCEVLENIGVFTDPAAKYADGTAV